MNRYLLSHRVLFWKPKITHSRDKLYEERLKKEERKQRKENLNQINRNIRHCFWNPFTREICGRNFSSWYRLSIFYFFLLSFIILFTFLLLWIFFLSLNPDQPAVYDRIGVSDSILSGGLGFRPQPDQELNSHSNLIWYKRNDPNDTKFWTSQLDEFLKFYAQKIPPNSTKSKSNLKDCFEGKIRANLNRVCLVNLKNSGPCSKENQYGYPKGQPCVLIKLNKIYGWIPKKIHPDKDFETFNQMPRELRKYIKKSFDKKKDDHIWISCEGANPGDRQHIGPIYYYPQPGIPFRYFPYLRQKEYQTPFVFVQFIAPRPGVMINIECRAWAKNIKRERRRRIGTVYFAIMVD